MGFLFLACFPRKGLRTPDGFLSSFSYYIPSGENLLFACHEITASFLIFPEAVDLSCFLASQDLVSRNLKSWKLMKELHATSCPCPVPGFLACCNAVFSRENTGDLFSERKGNRSPHVSWTHRDPLKERNPKIIYPEDLFLFL